MSSYDYNSLTLSPHWLSGEHSGYCYSSTGFAEHSYCYFREQTPPLDTMSPDTLSGGVFRPRGALARALYEKQQNDCKLRQFNKFDWYRCDLQLVNEDVGSKFHQLYPDEATRTFISESIDKSSWIWTQLWHCLAQSILGFFMTKTDINGWLGRGSMFVMSAEQLNEILNKLGITHRPLGRLADLGAGDGEVTIKWSSMFSSIHATEISQSMKTLLRKKGFHLLDIDNWWYEDKFDVISILNVLDRCSEPKSMLLTARQALSEHGILIVALVLPYRPYVEYESSHNPTEYLPIVGDTFEEQAESFVQFLKVEIGLELMGWTRVPYLCEGDINQSYYWLDDAIFILRKGNL